MKSVIRWFGDMMDLKFPIAFFIIMFLLWFIGTIFMLASYAHAEDYVITYYGQGVFSVEHDGVIYIQGEGRPDSNKDEDRSSQQSTKYKPPTATLERAERYESASSWLAAAKEYKKIGDVVKYREMVYKDIEKDLAKSPPDYRGAAWTANHYLEDKDLAVEYYGKYLDQRLNQ